MSRDLLILLHGVGADGAAMQPLAQALAPHLPGVALATPDAPFASPMGRRQWFSLEGISRENRPARVAEARAPLLALIDDLRARHGAEQGRLAVLGFSQGAIMTLDLLASGARPLAAAVAFSGRFASPAPLAPRPGAGVLLVHGMIDRVVPVTELPMAAAALQGAGVQVESLVLSGLGHRVSAEGLLAARRYLVDRLAPGPWLTAVNIR